MHFKLLKDYVDPIKALFNAFRENFFQVLFNAGVENITPWVCLLFIVYGLSGVSIKGLGCSPRSFHSGKP